MVHLKIFHDKDQANADLLYKIWCVENKRGYIFNHFGGDDPRLNVIHRVDCSKLDFTGKRTTIRKVCSSSLEQLMQYADASHGLDRWTFCSGKDCFPEKKINLTAG